MRAPPSSRPYTGDELRAAQNARTMQLIRHPPSQRAGRQARNLETITRSLQTLLGSLRRSGETQAPAAALEKALSALRTAMQELTGPVVAGAPRGRSARDRAAPTRGLRGVERRLSELSREWVGGARCSR